MEGRWIRACMSVCLCVRVFVIFQVSSDQKGLAKKARGGRENRAPEKGSWKHGDLRSSSPPRTAPPYPPPLSTLVQLHSDVSACPPSHASHASPLYSQPQCHCQGERERGRERESVAAGNTYWPFYRGKRHEIH